MRSYATQLIQDKDGYLRDVFADATKLLVAKRGANPFAGAKCLPRLIPFRVWELDAPRAQGLYFNPNSDGPHPCSVKLTARLNGRPPVITRVCQESRIVAHESAGVILEDDDDPPTDVSWGCTTTDGYPNDFWIDLRRDSAHINWHPLYQAIYQDGEGSALACIAWESRLLFGRRSTMREWFSFPCNQEAERFDVFEQVPSWWVIMRVVVIHASFQEAAHSGLFGLLGDVTVQIVSVSDEEKFNASYAFAEEKDRQISPIEGFKRVLGSLEAGTERRHSLRNGIRKVIIENVSSHHVPSLHMEVYLAHQRAPMI
ncbi:hypothetical protein N7520_002223 [Penicillium odoratum]|uniref:uncharacterized protein n=1 Tax=Penicillium odoratum TaxID=1167516 RepID=UPI002548C5E8|nr:uncharacterized protein N7520_002223 [Penicillium odoratum]KAJ5771694.1 hypothetical protein N7520_002223 [Penicillium odoratum]